MTPGLWDRLVALSFLLVACSGGDEAASSQATNPPPEVSAGSDQSVSEQDEVTLSGSVTDPNDVHTLLWAQISGVTVELENETTLSPSFTAPFVPQAEVLTFRLTAEDSANPPVTDEVAITIEDGGIVITRVSPDASSYIDHEIHPNPTRNGVSGKWPGLCYFL